MVVLSVVLTEDLVTVSVKALLFDVALFAVRVVVALLSVSKSSDRIYSCTNRLLLQTKPPRHLHPDSFQEGVGKMIDYLPFRLFCPDVFPMIRH